MRLETVVVTFLGEKAPLVLENVFDHWEFCAGFWLFKKLNNTETVLNMSQVERIEWMLTGGVADGRA